MVLIAHVVLALSSLIFGAILLVSPSRTKFYVNYGLIAGTIASGTYLVVTTGTHMLSACLTGLAYLGTVGIMTVLAHHRLARENI